MWSQHEHEWILPYTLYINLGVCDHFTKYSFAKLKVSLHEYFMNYAVMFKFPYFFALEYECWEFVSSSRTILPYQLKRVVFDLLSQSRLCQRLGFYCLWTRQWADLVRVRFAEGKWLQVATVAYYKFMVCSTD